MNRKLLALTTLGVVFVLLVLANVIVGAMGLNFRADLTKDRIYTLSDGTRNVLARIPDDRQVQIRLHATRDARLMPEVLRQYARNVEDLLVEYVNASGGRVTLERIDPRPDTEEEDRAVEDEIRPLRMAAGDSVYFGIAVQTLARREVIPFLNPNEEAQLEYQITRAIANTIASGEQVLAVASAMPVMGVMPMMPMMQQQGQEPWILTQQLERDYVVRDIGMQFDAIDEDVDVLLLIHPAGISPQAEYAIDQFVLRGGRVLAFVDPESIVSTLYGGGQNMFGMPEPGVDPASDLPKLLPAWGIEFDTSQVVADMNLRTPFNRREPSPTFLTLGEGEINSGNFVTAALDVVQVYESGAFKLREKDGMKHDILLSSSPNSDMVDRETARQARDQALMSFRSMNRRQILGVQVSGRLTTAFPDGPPPALPDDEDGMGFPPGLPPEFLRGAQGEDETEAPDEEAPADNLPTEDTPSDDESTEQTPAAEAGDGEPADGHTPVSDDGGTEASPAEVPAVDDNQPEAATDTDQPEAPEEGADAEQVDGEEEAIAGPPVDHLTESVSDEGLVMVFADSDMLYDRFVVVQDPMTGGLRLGNGNLPLVLNAVEFLLGGSDMIAIRSRTGASRPFTRMNELRDEVEAEFRPKIEELEQKILGIEEQMSDLRLQQDDQGNLVVLMTDEQRESLRALEPTARDLDRELRATRMEVRRRIDRMEMRIMLQNILVVPAVVVVFGVLLALVRRQRTRAR